MPNVSIMRPKRKLRLTTFEGPYVVLVLFLLAPLFESLKLTRKAMFQLSLCYDDNVAYE